MRRDIVRTLLKAVIMLLVFGWALAASAQGVPGDPGIGDSLYPGFGNGGYDVQHYTVSLKVDPKQGTLDGDVTFEATATQALSTFNLDFIGFPNATLTVNGETATVSRDGQEMTVTPTKPIAEGENFVVEVAYSGKPEAVTSVALPVQTGWVPYNDNPDCPCSFVLSEPDGTANWLPVNDHPLDKASYTFHVTVPKPYGVAANGDLTGVTDNGDTTTSTFEVKAPMASYLAMVDIAQFDLVSEPGTHGVPIRNYFEKSVPQATRALFARQDEMIGYFESLFGKYPFDVYGSVKLNTETGGALEAQTLSIFGTDSVAPDNTESEVTIAHELAHQWFGDSVSVADWSDIWLNESFATYAEGLWIEHSQGKAALESWVNDTYEYVAGGDGIVPPGKPAADDLFNDGVYYRGALALHALRWSLGDAVFFDLLQQWYAQHKDGNAGTADFIALAEKLSGKDMTAFFNAWLYDAKVPPLPGMGLAS
jgi:aminopeptidase N